MKKSNWILLTAWAFAVGLLTLITVFNQAKIDKFMGITANNEHIVNFSYPVQLKEIYVVPGQEVKKGQLLAKLIRSDLALKLNTLNKQIIELEAKKSIKLDDINRQLNTLFTKYELDLKKINMQIEQHKLKLKENKKLFQTIVNSDNKSFSILKDNIKTLQQEKQSIKTIYLNEENFLKLELESTNALYDAQINEIIKQKDILNAKEDRLTIYAPMNGKIQSVLYNQDSQIKPFDPLLTIHPMYPEYVTGYIHENIVNELKVGQKVSIESFKNSNNKEIFYGTIESISNHIEEIPIKLKKYKMVPLWGYKVSISLSENSLQLGEKVMITSVLKQNILEKKINALLEFLNLN